MAEARDRERLGEALDEAEHDRLKVGDGMHRGRAGYSARWPAGPVANQAKTKHPSARTSAASPCFTW